MTHVSEAFNEMTIETTEKMYCKEELHRYLNGPFGDISKVCEDECICDSNCCNNNCNCVELSDLINDIASNGIISLFQQRIDEESIRNMSVKKADMYYCSMNATYLCFTNFISNRIGNCNLASEAFNHLAVCDDFILEYIRTLYEYVKYDFKYTKSFYKELDRYGNLYNMIRIVALFCESFIKKIKKCECGNEYIIHHPESICEKCNNKPKIVTKCCKADLDLKLCLSLYPNTVNCHKCDKVIDIYEIVTDLLK